MTWLKNVQYIWNALFKCQILKFIVCKKNITFLGQRWTQNEQMEDLLDIVTQVDHIIFTM